MIVDRRRPETRERPSSRRIVAGGDQFVQHPAPMHEDRVRRTASAPYRSEKSNIAGIIERRPFEGGQGPRGNIRRRTSAQGDRLELPPAGDKHAARCPATRERRHEGDGALGVESDSGAIGEIRDTLAARDDIADRSKLGDLIADRDEQALIRLAADQGSEKCNLAVAVARRRDRLTADLEAIEAAADRCGLPARHELLQNRAESRRQRCFAACMPLWRCPEHAERERCQRSQGDKAARHPRWRRLLSGSACTRNPRARRCRHAAPGAGQGGSR